jgi:hypothetical protein
MSPLLECHEASKHHLLKFGFFLLDRQTLFSYWGKTCYCGHHTFLLGFPTGWSSCPHHPSSWCTSRRHRFDLLDENFPVRRSMPTSAGHDYRRSFSWYRNTDCLGHRHKPPALLSLLSLSNRHRLQCVVPPIKLLESDSTATRKLYTPNTT